tara:strand:+ start:837 stop:1295 length:459 start_codon:yes stop_codon:yes gene_type:complete
MSTIKVDTIQKANGTSQIGIDKIGGVTSASIVNVIAEGGSTTTNLAQGLGKAWAHVTGTGTVAIDDSFNASGMTDRGTGEYTVSYSNNMGNTHYACPFGGKNPSASSELGCLGLAESSDQLATGSIPFRVLFGNGTFGDYNELTLAILGDLA